MPREIELKLALPPSARRAFLRHPVLKEAIEVHAGEKLTNIYFDTADLKLRKERMALRLRKQGKTWLQTVKCAGVVSGGLASRPEWEQPYDGHAFDFSAVDIPDVRKRLEREQQRGSLVPVFETNFRRRTWVFEPAPGSRLLLTLDEGGITGSGRELPICELEIEIAGGDTGPLFDLAARLAEKLPLRPDDRSKAERGYRLFTGEALAPRHAGPSPVKPEDSPREAFRKVAFSCLSQFQANEEGVMESEAPEFIHQMRVSLRRLRSALRTFGPALPEGFEERFAGPLRNLATVLGAARDWDVALEDILAPAGGTEPDRLADIATLAEGARRTARQQARAAVAAPECGRLLLELVAALHGPAFAAEQEDRELPHFAQESLASLRKRVGKRAERAASLVPVQLHALRIAGKRLRYAREFFAPLEPEGKLKRELAELAELQTALGRVNDLENALRLLAPLAAGNPRHQEALAVVDAWQQGQLSALMETLPRRLAGLKRK